MCFRGFGSGFSCVRIEITAGDGKFAIAHCFDDGQLRGIAMAMIVIVVLSFMFSVASCVRAVKSPQAMVIMSLC